MSPPSETELTYFRLSAPFDDPEAIANQEATNHMDATLEYADGWSVLLVSLLLHVFVVRRFLRLQLGGARVLGIFLSGFIALNLYGVKISIETWTALTAASAYVPHLDFQHGLSITLALLLPFILMTGVVWVPALYVLETWVYRPHRIREFMVS